MFIRNVFYIIYLAVIIIGLLLCFYFTHKSSMPLKNILLSIQKGNPKAPELNSYAALEKCIQDAMTDNTKFSTLLDEQKRRLIHNFYEQLLSGHFSDRAELRSTAEYLGINLNTKMFGFLLVSFGSSEETKADYTEQNISQVYAKHLVLPNLHFRIHTHFLSMDQLGVFLLFPEDDPVKNTELLKQEFEPAFYDAFRKFSVELRCCSGRLYADPLNLPLSYNEARLTMTQVSSRPPQYTICFYDDMPPEPTFYYYPVGVETKLKGLVNSRNEAGIDELLDMIFEENLVKRKLPNYVLSAFFLDMKTGIVRILNELKLSIPIDLFPSYHKAVNTETECNHIRSCYHHLVNSLAAQPEEDDTPAQIVHYLETHFGDSMLSVLTVAEEFHMSSSYFSTYFKKHMDVTFSKYLENLRISKACELIKNTDKNIESISAEVGYSSSLPIMSSPKSLILQAFL